MSEEFQPLPRLHYLRELEKEEERKIFRIGPAEGEEEEEAGEPEELEEEKGEEEKGLSIKLSNSTFAVEIHMLGVEPNEKALASAKNFLREVLELAQEFRMLH